VAELGFEGVPRVITLKSIEGDASTNAGTNNNATLNLTFAAGATIRVTRGRWRGTTEDATVAVEFTLEGGNAGIINGNASFDCSDPVDCRNAGSVTGDAVFINSANDATGTVGGNATFTDSDNAGTVTGGADFLIVSGSSENSGTVTGDATFNAGTVNAALGSVGGSAYFTAASNLGSVGGDANFVDSDNAGAVAGSADFLIVSGSSENSGTVTSNATFNPGTANTATGIVDGFASFTDASYSRANTSRSRCRFRFCADGWRPSRSAFCAGWPTATCAGAVKLEPT
jgi:hypothetical protein